MLFAVGGFAPSAQAETALGSSLSSDNFRVLDSQHGGFGGVSSSSSSAFRLIGTIGDIAIGSSSLSTFNLRSGFLYFPKVVAPTLTTATASDAQVDLVWLAAEAFQGLSVSGYNVCTKPSAGAYTCQNVGAVLTYTKTGLTNGTTYTFKIQAKDAFGAVIADSNEKSATPASAGPTPTPVPPGGGGGGGGYSASVVLDGLAYPFAGITILRDAHIVGSVRADAGGHFNFSDNVILNATYRYSLFATDSDGRNSAMISFMVRAQNNSTTVGGILLPPTIEISATEISAGTPVAVRGQATPGATVIIELSPEMLRQQVTARSDGLWSTAIATTGFRPGVRSVQARTRLASGVESAFSYTVRFGVDVKFKEKEFDIPNCGKLRQPDLNCDGRVNIIDLSIMVYWYKRPVAKDFYVDLSMDGAVDIVDFSILAYYWTG